MPSGRQQIWMSHRDTVEAVPPGLHGSGPHRDLRDRRRWPTPTRRLYGVQFHPEVVHTPHGRQILTNFLFDVCGCTARLGPAPSRPDWSSSEIREVVGDRNVFFFVSGGVDSTVAFTLCLRALGAERVSGVYVDTGLMREGETEFVRACSTLGSRNFMVEARRASSSSARWRASPTRRQSATSSASSSWRCRSASSNRHFLDGNWILGQGTIYPDTIESGGTAKADTIKTHHNRVAGIQRLIEEGRIVEPLTSFYKDEVREIGRELGLPDELLDRHPFPGPGLAIRCLCATDSTRPSGSTAAG